MVLQLLGGPGIKSGGERERDRQWIWSTLSHRRQRNRLLRMERVRW